jgi:hypothetical protein
MGPFRAAWVWVIILLRALGRERTRSLLEAAELRPEGRSRDTNREESMGIQVLILEFERSGSEWGSRKESKQARTKRVKALGGKRNKFRMFLHSSNQLAHSSS